MKRAKSKADPSSSTRNIATQTAEFDTFTEVARLQEQIRLLQLQNDVLKQQTLKKFDVLTHNKQLRTPETPKSNVEKYSCKCKKNCSSQACGCVKKNNKCNSSCKCNDEICLNQKLEHDDNKENVIKVSTNDSTRKSEPVEIMFDPMKPKHQLSRTPPNKKFGELNIKTDESMVDSINETQSYHKPNEDTKIVSPMQGIKTDESMMDDINKTQLHYKPNEDTRIVSPMQDVKEEHIDWKEHTAQLIACKKCKRTFLPHRIQKHEACCKKI